MHTRNSNCGKQPFPLAELIFNANLKMSARLIKKTFTTSLLHRIFIQCHIRISQILQTWKNSFRTVNPTKGINKKCRGGVKKQIPRVTFHTQQHTARDQNAHNQQFTWLLHHTWRCMQVKIWKIFYLNWAALKSAALAKGESR